MAKQNYEVVFGNDMDKIWRIWYNWQRCWNNTNNKCIKVNKYKGDVPKLLQNLDKILKLYYNGKE